MQMKIYIFEFYTSVLYGVEPCGLKVREKKRLNVMEMKFLGSICGVTRIDKITN